MAKRKTATPKSGGATPPPATDNLVVVDGSNIATEGRQLPSLAQLNEAVLSFRAEYPDVQVTVVVDATFGHRIDNSEVDTFDEAVAHNELVAPPAGAIGRGDAFVLSIADKSGAQILSNDSFQEFHGEYPWLFDEGRLIGGKPVPHVGWVFVNRVPVKGPVSRKSRTAARDQAKSPRKVSELARQPMPVPKAPPPGAKPPAADTAEEAEEATEVEPSRPPRGGPVNELLPFLDFIEHHPIGSSVTGTVESYSSHGAYVTIGNLRGYVPLRLMRNPPPRSAREVMKIGESVTVVVDSLAPTRRSVDLALPGVSEAEPAPATTSAEAKKSAAEKSAAKKSAAKKSAAKKAPAKKDAEQQEPPAKKSAGKKESAGRKASAGKKAAASESAAKKTAATKTAAKKAPAKKAPAEKTATKKAPAKKSNAKKSAAKKTPAKKTAAKKTTSTKKESPAT